MKYGRVLVVVLSVVLSAGGLSATSALGAGRASKGAVVASGIVVSNGVAVRGATVAVFANPTIEALDVAGAAGLPPSHLGVGETNGSGRFLVRGDLESLPSGYRINGGGADVMVVVDDGVRSMTWSYTLRLPDAGPGLGTVAAGAGARVPEAGRYDDGSLAPLSRFDLGTGTVWDVGNDPASWLDDNGQPFGELRRADAARQPVEGPSPLVRGQASSPGGVSGFAGTPCIWVATDAWIYGANEMFDNVYSFSGALATMTQGVNNSTSHTLGILLQYPDGSFSTAGGTSTISTSVSASSPGMADAAVWNRVNYRKYDLVCYPYLIRSEWRPVNFHSFFTNFTYAGDINYGNCSQQYAGGFFMTSSASNETFSWGVQLGFFQLSSQAGYGSSVSLRYNFTQHGWICGNSPQGPAQSAGLSARAA
jgi:hypothetical protein